jgi:gas vesicle protein
MLRVLIVFDQDGRFHGRILEYFDVYNGVYLSTDFRLIDFRKKREFCLISRCSEFLNVIRNGQIWECTVEREITDRKGNKVKIVNPIKLLHEHSLYFKRNDDERIPIFSVVSGDWYEFLPVEHETKVEEYKDEFIHYVEKYPVLRGYCPYCQQEIVRDDFARIRETIYQAPIEEIIAYWKEYLGEEFQEVKEMWWELQRQISKVKKECNKKREEIENRIEELKFAGVVMRKLTLREKEEMFNDRYRDWMKAGGDPFEEFEISDVVYEIVDKEKYNKAQEEIEKLKKILSQYDELEEKQIKELKMKFYDNEKVERVLERAHYLLTQRVYPCILAKITEYDPYFFEFTSLDYLPSIEAIELIFRACKK